MRHTFSPARALFALARADFAPIAAVLVASSMASATGAAQSAQSAQLPRQTTETTPANLDSLVARALAVNPAIHAASARLTAALARVGPAGARPDPMLMAGIQNFPVAKPGFSDFMTMKMIGIGQTFPYPGKLPLQTRVAEYEAAAERAALETARLDVTATVETAYYDLAFADRSLEIVRDNQAVLANLITVSEARYTSGTGTLADVLRARTESANLDDAASAIVEQRRADAARLNAALNLADATPHPSVVMPGQIVRAAVADSSADVHFVSDGLGARAADSPLYPLDSLQELAAATSPAIHEHVARIAAQQARVALANEAHLPDISVSLSYGQRQGFADMASAVVSVPLPLQKRRKQDAEVAEASAVLTEMEARHHEMVNAIDAAIATQVSTIERARTALALAKRAILPEAQATLASSIASYQVGRLDFSAVMDAQIRVFNTEITYYRSLTDFAKSLAELKQTVGTGVLR